MMGGKFHRGCCWGWSRGEDELRVHRVDDPSEPGTKKSARKGGRLDKKKKEETEKKGVLSAYFRFFIVTHTNYRCNRWRPAEEGFPRANAPESIHSVDATHEFDYMLRNRTDPHEVIEKSRNLLYFEMFYVHLPFRRKYQEQYQRF